MSFPPRPEAVPVRFAPRLKVSALDVPVRFSTLVNAVTELALPAFSVVTSYCVLPVIVSIPPSPSSTVTLPPDKLKLSAASPPEASAVVPLVKLNMSFPPRPEAVPVRFAPRLKVSTRLPPVRFSTLLKVKSVLMLPVLSLVMFQVLIESAPVRVSVVEELPIKSSMSLKPVVMLVAERVCRFTVTAVASAL